MSRRVNKEIMQRTYEENEDFFRDNPDILAKFNALRDELTNASKTALRHLTSQGVPDEEEWYKLLEPYVKEQKTWLSSPWLVAEFYLYRRILEATSYFVSSKEKTYMKDLFERQKKMGTVSSVSSAEGVLQRVSELTDFDHDNLAVLTSISLWGNRMDLSIWPTGSEGNDKHNTLLHVIESSHENLLWDDTEAICEYASKNLNAVNIDIIVDNAGLELVTDLMLAEYIITSKMAKYVTFRLKSFPTFVSDAMEKDLRDTIRHYAEVDASSNPFAKKAGMRWQQYLDNGQWVCKEDDFWVQPKPMWDMPQSLYEEMSSSSLAFVKGDANYRRLLGDLEWDLSKDLFQNVVGDYFPCPVVALRTLKAMMGCGMKEDKVEWAKSIDDDWMVNGRFGVIHFGMPPKDQ